jgi:chaperonin GroES
MKIKPLSDKVVLKLLEPQEKTSGGIYLPDQAQEETHLAEVIAVGEGRISDSGELIKTTVKPKQKVLIKGQWAGETVTVDGIEYKIVSEPDILAVVE